MEERITQTTPETAGEKRFSILTHYDKRTLYALNDLVCRTTRRRSYRLRKAFLLVLGILGLLSGSMLMMIYSQLETSERLIAIGGLLVAAIALTEAVFLKRIGAWNTRRMMPKGRDKSLAVLDDTGLGSTESGMQSHYDFDAFTSAYESQEFFYLLLDSRHALILAKEGIEAPEGSSQERQVEQMREFLKEKLPFPIQYIRQKLPKKKQPKQK